MTVLALIVLGSWSAAATPESADPSSVTIELEQQTMMNVIKKQFCDFQRQEYRAASSGKDDGQFGKWIASLNEDGAWPDIDYADQTSGGWRTADHLSRLVKLCVAYTSPKSRFHAEATLSKAIHSALGHWLRNDYGNPNWWHGEIGVPMTLSRILLLLDSELSPEERAAGIRIVARSVIDSPPARGRGELTGQNRVWVAANALTHGLIASDFELVQRACGVIFEEVSIATQAGGAEVTTTHTGPGQIRPSTQEGIQPDFSFLQHGPLLQLGNYGLGFANDTALWLTVLRGTSLAPGEEKITIIRDYLLKGEATVIWKGVMDISACGRQLGPGSPAGKGRSAIRSIEIAKEADSAHAEEYDKALAEIGSDARVGDITAQNTYFWRADFMVHRRPGFYVSTRMNSTRVYASELVNGENLQGGYLGDGATFLYRTGQEYKDLFPVWDWSRLPGVTDPSTTDRTLLKPKNFKVTNKNAFVGGVSDGTYGAAVMTLNRDGLVAKKGWFYFDDQIVCMGAGISGGKGSTPIVTGINQCISQGEIAVDTGDGLKKIPAGLQEYATLKWAWHDNVGYIFPEPQRMFLGSQKQTGSWNLVSTSGNPAPIVEPVFSVWIDHGVNPQDAHYSYVMLPGVSKETLQTQAATPGIEILSNTSSLQASRNSKLKMTQAIFYQPGTLAYVDGGSLTVDAPCLILLDETSNKLSIADPTQLLTELTVTLNGVSVKYKLPQGAQAGSSYTTLHPPK